MSSAEGTGKKKRRGKRQVTETTKTNVDAIVLDETDPDGVGVNHPTAELYVVENVCGKKIVKGSIQYLIKWKDYPDSVNSWEPLENLACPDLIEEYENKLSEKTSQPKKTKKRPSDSKISTNVTKKIKSKSDNNGPSTSKAKAAQVKVEPEEPVFIPMTKFNTGFNRGLPPKRVMHATDSAGQLMFLMEWEGTKEIDLVPSREANVKCPQLVIQFYESLITKGRLKSQNGPYLPPQIFVLSGSESEIESEVSVESQLSRGGNLEDGKDKESQFSSEESVSEPDNDDDPDFTVVPKGKKKFSRKEKKDSSGDEGEEENDKDEEMEEASDSDESDMPQSTVNVYVDEFGVIRERPCQSTKQSESHSKVGAKVLDVSDLSSEEENGLVGLIRPIDQNLLLSSEEEEEEVDVET